MPTPPLSDALCVEALAVYEKHGRNQQHAADALGIPRATFQCRLRVARQREALLNGEPGPIPRGTPEVEGLEPYLLKGVSSYVGADGVVKGQWLKTKVDDQQRLRALLAALEQRAERIQPLPPIERSVVAPLADSDLLNLVTITDYHLGCLAWRREGGADWDITIARETFKRVFGGMVQNLPRAGTCVINQLGDFLHTDGLVPVTPAHGNILDADSRFQKIAEEALDLIEWIVVEALKRHDKVRLICAEGNHDESSSVWLRVSMKRIFRDNPRVTVDDNPLPYYAHQHGRVMLAFHHGHKLKPTELPSLFAAQYPRIWGATDFRYGHSGHEHHVEEKEHRGMTWLKHPTIAARDAYAARGGWVADRRASAITYHADLGEVGRLTATPEMYR